MVKRTIRQRKERKLSDRERAEVERLAAQAEASAEQAEARRFFAEHARLRELLAILKAERERQGLSLSEVADRIEMDPANLHRLENSSNANPTLETVQRLAHALGKQVRVELIDEAA